MPPLVTTGEGHAIACHISRADLLRLQTAAAAATP